MFAVQRAITESAVVMLAIEPTIAKTVEAIERLYCSRAETEPHIFPNGLIGLRTSFEITLIAWPDKPIALVYEAADRIAPALADDNLRAGEDHVVIDCVLERATVEPGIDGFAHRVRAAFVALSIED
jgi:hypothetical protein